MATLDFRWIAISILLSSMVYSTESYKILFAPLAHRSHIFCMMAIAKELGQLGHESHIFLSDGIDIDPKLVAEGKAANVTILRYVRTRSNEVEDIGQLQEELARTFVTSNSSFEKFMNLLSHFLPLQARELLMENEATIEELKSIRFDIAVLDIMFVTKYLYLLPHRLGIPWITYMDYPEPWPMRTPWLPSFVPGQFSLQSERMDFTGRIWNVISTAIMNHKRDSFRVPEDILDEYQKYGDFHSLDDLMKNSKFWILTSDVLLDYARPMMPHMTEVGGLTTQTAKKLPEDIQTFLDGAEEGVIVVSFGSTFSSFPDALLRKFLQAVSRIERHRIVWRLSNISAEFQIPDFVRTYRWLPQNDILAHSKIRLFITHCGNNGQYEALHHGVPMIGFPIAGDQQYNAIRLEHKGYGISMNVREFTSDELYTNIMKILHDPSYKRRISLASEIFRSAPQRPPEKAAYWIEHVIKFGSNHLQSAGKDLNFFQYFLLDVFAAFLITGVLFLILLMQTILWVKNKCFKSDHKIKLKMK